MKGRSRGVILCLWAAVWMTPFPGVASDYTTAGSGATYTLTSLTTIPGATVVTGGPTSFTLNGNLTLSATDVLTIGPGESLWAADDPSGLGYLLIIRGQLLVQGTSGNPVRFGSHSTLPGSWRGIMIAAASGPASEIQYAEISHAQFGVQVRAAVAPLIDNSRFLDCRLAGVVVEPGFGATVQLNEVNSTWGEANGIVLNGAAGAVVTTNTITGSPGGLYSGDSDSATLIADNQTSTVLAGIVSAGSDAAVIRNNLVQYGYLGGVAAENSTASWDTNALNHQATANLAVANTAAPVLRRNTFSQSGSLAGAYIMDLATPDLGSNLEDGQNNFQSYPVYDLVNFSALNQLANGNTWSYSPPDIGIYDHFEDLGDADGNGVVSGYVFLNGVARVDDWMLFQPL